jgi:hypothetical protein
MWETRKHNNNAESLATTNKSCKKFTTLSVGHSFTKDKDIFCHGLNVVRFVESSMATSQSKRFESMQIEDARSPIRRHHDHTTSRKEGRHQQQANQYFLGLKVRINKQETYFVQHNNKIIILLQLSLISLREATMKFFLLHNPLMLLLAVPFTSAFSPSTTSSFLQSYNQKVSH